MRAYGQIEGGKWCGGGEERAALTISPPMAARTARAAPSGYRVLFRRRRRLGRRRRRGRGVRARGGRRRVVGCGFASRLFSLVLLGGGFAKPGGVEDFGPADRMAQKKIVKKPRNWINFTNKFKIFV